MALNLDSESFKAEKNSIIAQYSFRTSDRSDGTLLMVRAIYSAGLPIILYPRDYVSLENA